MSMSATVAPPATSGSAGSESAAGFGDAIRAGHLPALDGFRAVAALSVVIAHGLGVTLFEMLSGQLPSPQGTSEQPLGRHENDPPADIRRTARRLPSSLAATVMKIKVIKPNSNPVVTERVLAAAGAELDTRPARSANERRTDLICETLADRVLADPDVLHVARDRLAMLREVHGDRTADRWLDAWEHLLDAGPDAVAAVLTSLSPAARPLKSTTPLAGIGLIDETTRADLVTKARVLTPGKSAER